MYERRRAINRKEGIIKVLTCLAFFATCFFNINFALAGDTISEVSSTAGEETPWNINADSLQFNEEEDLYIAKGRVTITKDDQKLSAREAVYDGKTGIVELSGDVRFESGEDLFTGESGIFNLNDRTGSITRGRLFLGRNNYHISGDEMEKIGDDTYLIKNFHLTTCDGPSPAWSITGSEVRVTVEGYGKVRHAFFKVHEFPFLYLPYLIFPAKTERQTGLLPPRLGYSDRNGLDLEIPFFWAISKGSDATFYERFMSRRGLMQGFEFRYVAEYDSEGVYLFDILSDKIEDKDLSNPDQAELSPFARTNKTRYWLRSRTEQQLPYEIRARLDTDVVSDQDYLREFQGGLFGFRARTDLADESGRPLDEVTSPLRRSALRLSRDRQEYSLQAISSYYQRPEDPVNNDTPQPLAGIDFALLPRPLTTLPLAFSLDADYDYIWRDFGQKGHRFSLSPEVTYPVWLGPYLELEPSLGFTRDMQWLDDNPDNIDIQSRDAYQFQTRLSTIAERIYGFEWNQVKRLKHKLVPSLSYRYRVHKDENRYQPWFEPIDVEGKVNLATFSIENFIDVRKEDKKGNVEYAQWGMLSLSQGYDIDEAGRDYEPWRKKEPFEPLVGILTFMPFSAVDLDAEAHWDHYLDAFSFYDLSLELRIDRAGGKKDSYQIDYTYFKDGSKGLNYYLNVNLLYGFSVGSSLRRDVDLRQNIEKSYWLEYMSQCWGIRMIVQKVDDESSIMVQFSLLGIGDLNRL